jgi:hypothetical protein
MEALLSALLGCQDIGRFAKAEHKWKSARDAKPL